jgi:hypothetical protein
MSKRDHPSGRVPRVLYFLDVTTRGKLKYRQKGGGKFTQRSAAETAQGYLKMQGIESVLYESKPIEWVEVPE